MPSRRAARLGKGDSDVIEDALRRDLGFDLLDRPWGASDVADDEAMALAVEAQHARGPDAARAVLDANVYSGRILSRCCIDGRPSRPGPRSAGPASSSPAS